MVHLNAKIVRQFADDGNRRVVIEENHEFEFDKPNLHADDDFDLIINLALEELHDTGESLYDIDNFVDYETATDGESLLFMDDMTLGQAFAFGLFGTALLLFIVALVTHSPIFSGLGWVALLSGWVTLLCEL